MSDPIPVRICTDCACWHASGDLSALELLDDAERDARYRAVTAAPGVPDGYVVVVDGDDGFTWADCDTCRDARGGDRCAATLVDMRPRHAARRT